MYYEKKDYEVRRARGEKLGMTRNRTLAGTVAGKGVSSILSDLGRTLLGGR